MVLIRRDEGNWRAYFKVARARLIAIFAFLAVGTFHPFALAQASPQEQPSADNGSENASNYHPSTAALPVVVKLLNTGESQAEATQEAQRIANNDAFNKSATKWTIRLTVALVGATILQFLALIYQSYWLRSSVKLTREVLVHDKRAFVFPTGFTQLYEPRTDNPNEFNWRFRPTWKNSGKTPTKNLQILSVCELRNVEIPDGFDFKKLSGITGAGFIGPGVELQAGMCPLPTLAAISPNDILETQRNEKFLYIMGWAIYSDALEGKKKYTTRFCWRITVVGNPKTFVPGDKDRPLRFDWTMHKEGNHADEEEN